MQKIVGFFKKFGLPSEWINVDEEGISINEDDSGEFSEINDGDEVWIDVDDIIINDSNISVRGVKLPENLKHRFDVDLEKGDSANKEKLAKMINELKHFAG